MSTLIVCPNCKTQFEPEDAIARSVEERVRKDFNQKWAELSRKKEEEMQADIKQKEAAIRKELEQKVNATYETQLRLLEDTNKTNQAKLAEAREKELDFLKKMQDLKTREQELELQMQRRMLEERNKLADQIKKEEEERNKQKDWEFEMKLKERDKQLDDQRKLIEEMKRKSEQGSMQLQGEVQELVLEELLRSTFPFDLVNEVGKGKRGADCTLTVRNNFGQECGKIIFESKRTKDFGKDWIEKLEADMRTEGADIGVLVSQAMPDGISTFGQRGAIWICTFAEAATLVHILRDLLIKVHTASKSNENKGDKMTLLYTYLTSSEFGLQWKAIADGFRSMKASIQKEREQMEKLWKAREKQLEKVLLNAAHIQGSIQGIAGMDVNLELEQGDEGYMLE